MPIIFAWIVDAGVWLVGSQIGRALLLAMAWFGVNYVTLKVVLDPAITILQNTMSGASVGSAGSQLAVMWAWMLVLKFPGALNMVVSAYVTKVAVKGGTGVFKKVVS